MKTPSSEESGQWAVGSENTMGPVDETSSSTRACGIFRSDRVRWFSGLSRLASMADEGAHAEAEASDNVHCRRRATDVNLLYDSRRRLHQWTDARIPFKKLPFPPFWGTFARLPGGTARSAKRCNVTRSDMFSGGPGHPKTECVWVHRNCHTDFRGLYTASGGSESHPTGTRGRYEPHPIRSPQVACPCVDLTVIWQSSVLNQALRTRKNEAIFVATPPSTRLDRLSIVQARYVTPAGGPRRDPPPGAA
jgi:hypothetical protein